MNDTDQDLPGYRLSYARTLALYDEAAITFLATIQDPPKGTLTRFTNTISNDPFIDDILKICLKDLPSLPIHLPADFTSEDLQKAVETSVQNYLVVLIGYTWDAIRETGVEKE